MNIYFSLSIDQYPPYGITQLTQTASSFKSILWKNRKIVFAGIGLGLGLGALGLAFTSSFFNSENPTTGHGREIPQPDIFIPSKVQIPDKSNPFEYLQSEIIENIPIINETKLKKHQHQWTKISSEIQDHPNEKTSQSETSILNEKHFETDHSQTIKSARGSFYQIPTIIFLPLAAIGIFVYRCLDKKPVRKDWIDEDQFLSQFAFKEDQNLDFFVNPNVETTTPTIIVPQPLEGSAKSSIFPQLELANDMEIPEEIETENETDVERIVQNILADLQSIYGINITKNGYFFEKAIELLTNMLNSTLSTDLKQDKNDSSDSEIHKDDPSDIAEKILEELKNNDISTNVTLYPKIIKKVIEALRSEVEDEINKQLSTNREENFFLCKSLEEFKG